MKVMKFLITGFGIGYICTTVLMLSFIGLNETTTQVLIWFIASGIFGVSSMIFEIEKLSILTKAGIHIIICLFVVISIGYYYYKEYLITVVLSFVVMYVIIFAIIGLIERNEIKKLNQKLKSKEN